MCDMAGAAGLKSDATIKLKTTWMVVAHSLFRTLAVEVDIMRPSCLVTYLAVLWR